jgi:hypothetical protein
LSGAVPALRSRICTLYGSPSRWLTETKNPPVTTVVGESAPEGVPEPRGELSPAAAEEALPPEVLTVTDSRSWLELAAAVVDPSTTSLGGVLSRATVFACESPVAPSRAAAAAATAPIAPSAMAETTAWRIGRALCRGRGAAEPRPPFRA